MWYMGVCGGVSMHVHKQTYTASINEASCWCCSVTSDSLQPHGLETARPLCPWDSPSKNTGVGCRFLLQGIFPNWTSASCISCLRRQVLYHMNYLGSPTKPALAPKFICSIAIPLLWLCLSRSYSQRQTIILREPFKPIEIVLEFFNNITIIIAMILVNVSFYTGNCALNKTLSQLRHEPYWRNVSNIIFILKDSVYITDFKNTMITHEKFPQCW